MTSVAPSWTLWILATHSQEKPYDWCRAEYDYHHMACEMKDTRILRVLYNELGLNAPGNRQSVRTDTAPAFSQTRSQSLRLSSLRRSPLHRSKS